MKLHIYEYDHGAIKLLGIETKLKEQNFSLSVHDKIEWVLVQNLTSYNLAPADIPIAKKIMELSKDV